MTQLDLCGIPAARSTCSVAEVFQHCTFQSWPLANMPCCGVSVLHVAVIAAVHDLNVQLCLNDAQFQALHLCGIISAEGASSCLRFVTAPCQLCTAQTPRPSLHPEIHPKICHEMPAEYNHVPVTSDLAVTDKGHTHLLLSSCIIKSWISQTSKSRLKAAHCAASQQEACR